MSVTLIPWGENILVQADKIGERQVGKIVISSHTAEQTSHATIIAIGEDALNGTSLRPPTKLRVGNKIFFQSYAGTHIDMKTYGFVDDSIRIMREEQVLGVIKEE